MLCCRGHGPAKGTVSLRCCQEILAPEMSSLVMSLGSPKCAWVTPQCPCCGVCHSPVSLQCPGSQPSVQPGSPNLQATPVRCSPSIFAFLFHLWIWAGSFLGWGRTGQVQVSPPPTLTLSQDLSQQTALQMSKSSKSTNKKHPQYKFMSKVME